MAKPSAGASTSKAMQSELVRSIIREHHRTPIEFYRIKDVFMDVTSNPNFIDAMLLMIGFTAMCMALPFYPIALTIILPILIFAFTLRQPFLGLIVFMVMAFPAIVYQMPGLAWIYVVAVSASLILGYMHYRTLTFAYILIPLAFSSLGYFLEIPIFIIAVLVVGYKRAMLLSVITILGIVMLSGVTGVPNTGYILYDPQLAYSAISLNPAVQYVTPGKPALSLLAFPGGVVDSLALFSSSGVIDAIPSITNFLLFAMAFQPERYILEIGCLLAMIFAIDIMAITSRSRFKGTKSSLAGIVYPIIFILMSILFKSGFSYSMPFVSFIITPASLYILELYNINIVKAMDVRKYDIRRKFGDAFEDLQSENYTGGFSDIGDYEATKKELHDAVIAPIEERGVSRAYNVKPAKGILLFGPPGTGKTMLMRALANDIHAGFYLVKASNLVSAYPGETERMMSNIFAIAKKNAPTVLFFDEIDAISRSRESDVDETHRQALSQLLVELDGFQRLSNIVVVGATNAPQLIDPALLRPGRFDKIVYMPLPDFNGRKAIFKIYLSKLPISKGINMEELAEKTERFSGADIKALTENVAQIIAQEASNQHKVLEITQEDMLNAIRATKPSTTLAQLDDYNRFKIDFERRSFEEGKSEKGEVIGIEDVIGLEDAKKAIVEAIQIPLMHPDLVKRYDIKPINGMLMFGPPGTGKSMLMRAISNEMKGVTILELKGADVAGEGKEGAVTLLRNTFNRAIENIPSIIFVDEIDTLIPKREGATEKGALITGEMLEEIDKIKKFTGIVIIAATNRPEALDPAILRAGRLDKLIFVRPPNPEERAKLFGMYMRNVPVSKGMDLDALGKESDGFTGADIANVCREAKTKALSASIKSGQEIKITQEDIMAIMQKLRPSAPNIVVSSYLTFLARYGQR